MAEASHLPGAAPLVRRGPDLRRPRLYDLVADVGETTDLAAQRPGLVHRLGEKLIGWLDDTDAPLATLRAGQPTRVIEDFTGDTYANGRVTHHRRDTITIAAGDPVPYLLPTP